MIRRFDNQFVKIYIYIIWMILTVAHSTDFIFEQLSYLYINLILGEELLVWTSPWNSFHFLVVTFSIVFFSLIIVYFVADHLEAYIQAAWSFIPAVKVEYNLYHNLETTRTDILAYLLNPSFCPI